MSEQPQSVHDDIAFMRSLAEAGRDKPMLGGAILLAAGAIFGTASLVVWYQAAVRSVEGVMYPAVWGGAFLLYLACLIPLLGRLPRSANTMQAATGIAWSGAGWAMLFICASLFVLSHRLESAAPMFAIASIFMALYGAAWWVAATLMRRRWMQVCAVGSFVMAVAIAWFSNSHTMWLLYAASLFAFLAAPGLVLMRQARRAG